MQKPNNLSLAALICGIVAVVFCFIPIPGFTLYLAIGGLGLGITAIVLGAKGMKNAKVTGEGGGMAVAGLVTGIIATVICGLFVLCVACALAGLGFLAGMYGSEAIGAVAVIL